MPRVYDRSHAEALSDALETVWAAQGRAAGAKDQAAIRKAWFDPLARGARLRAAIDSLPPVRDLVPHWDSLDLAAPLVLLVNDSRSLVSMEGHAFSQLLQQQLQAHPQASRIRLRWSDTDQADRALLDDYRSAVLTKIHSVIDLRVGGGAPLLPQAIGQILLLILNGNFGPEHALRRPSNPRDQAVVDDAVAQMVSEFAESLSPSKRGRTAGAYSLYSGYAMTEARRRLGSDLAENPVYLAVGSRQRVTDRLVADLRRRKVSAGLARQALEALIERYEVLRPSLAQYGLAQGKPSDAVQLREAFRLAWDTSGEVDG
ncbi:hypothetical protein [Nocardioides sp. Leaf285]|uniref:hypothetical protein n=1 Tax=Nocardioides sp. Leaf285 TaxID=1736322 RepID=UPI0012E9ABBB|nr:hypothetical protein [Nocardioides sp. Leaf285]